MSRVDVLRELARYNRWMNEKLYDAVAGLSGEDRTRDLGAFFGSVLGTLNHLLLADRAWLARFHGDRERFASRDAEGRVIEIRGLDQILYPDLDRLRIERERTDDDLQAWVEGLAEADLDAPLRYRTSTGASQEHPTWWAVFHAFNHQTHHRGQLTALLTRLGVDPGVTDLVVMLRAGPDAGTGP